MKANRLFLFAIAAVVLLSSCTKEFYFDDLHDGVPSGRSSGRSGEGGVTMSHYDYNIDTGDWQLITADDGSSYLFASLSVPAIDARVVSGGSVTVSRGYTDDDGYTVWTPLPMIRAEALDYNTETEYLYSNYLDFEWTEGYVYIYFTATDLFVEEDHSAWPSYYLRVTILKQ